LVRHIDTGPSSLQICQSGRRFSSPLPPRSLSPSVIPLLSPPPHSRCQPVPPSFPRGRCSEIWTPP
jgi:hypothetical protein